MKKVLFIIIIFLFSSNLTFSNDIYLDCQLVKTIDKDKNKTTNFLKDEGWSNSEIHFFYKIHKKKITIIKGVHSGKRMYSGETFSKEIDISNTDTGILNKKTDTELVFSNSKNSSNLLIIDRLTLDMISKGEDSESYYKCKKIEALL